MFISFSQDELVNIAEKLAKNKDMFRVDIFVGLSSHSPSLQQGDRRAAVKHVVSESEIYPTTVFHSEKMTQEAARLWIAGYKIGNYKVVNNTEVPKEFLETGSLSIGQEL